MTNKIKKLIFSFLIIISFGIGIYVFASEITNNFYAETKINNSDNLIGGTSPYRPIQPINLGGTGTSSAPTIGQYLTGNASGGYDLSNIIGSAMYPAPYGYFTNLIASTTQTDTIYITQSIKPGPAIISTSSPSVDVAFEYDTDTGLNWENDNELAIYTGGADYLHIDNAGKVGIGTSDPNKKLEINAGSTANEGIQINTTGNTAGVFFHNGLCPVDSDCRFGGLYADYSSNGIYLNSEYAAYPTNTGPIGFQIEGVTKMLLDKSGNVGIGTTSPSGLLSLSKESTGNYDTSILLGSTYSGTNTSAKIAFDYLNYDLGIFAGRPSYGTITFFTDPDGGGDIARMHIAKGGNVGIGTTDPTNLLHLKKAGSYADGEAMMYLDGDINSGAGNNVYGQRFDMRNAKPTSYVIGQRSEITNDYTANADLSYGIGFSALITNQAPTQGLSIGVGFQAQGYTYSNASMTNFKGVDILDFDNGGSGTKTNAYGIYIGDLTPFVNSYGVYQATSGMKNYFAGNVGIGTASPGLAGHNKALTISGGDSGTAALEILSDRTDNVVGTAVEFYNDGAAGSYTKVGRVTMTRENADNSAGLGLWTANAGSIGERVRIDKSGNVGIGTTDVDAKLKVAGTVSLGSSNAIVDDFYRTLTIQDGISNEADAAIFGRGNYGAAMLAFWSVSGAMYQIGVPSGSEKQYLAFQESGADRMVIQKTSGNVGIGTTTPTEKLQIASGNILLDNGQYLKWKGSGGVAKNILTYGSSNNLHIATGATNGNDIIFKPRQTEAMRIKQGGNIGIGTTTPAVSLDINGYAKVLQTATSTACSNNLMGSIFYNQSNDKFWGCGSGSSWQQLAATGGNGTVTSVDTAYPLTGGAITSAGTISLAFGTTTPNAWSGLQTLNGGASTTLLTVSSIASTSQLIISNNLKIPANTNPTIDTQGYLAINTTVASSSVRYHDGTAERALFDIVEKTLSIPYSIASTTASTTIPLAFASPHGETWEYISCKTTANTAQIEFGDGTTFMDYQSLTTARTTDSSLSNNTFTPYEDRVIVIGQISADYGWITCSAGVRLTPD